MRTKKQKLKKKLKIFFLFLKINFRKQFLEVVNQIRFFIFYFKKKKIKNSKQTNPKLPSRFMLVSHNGWN